MSLHIVGELSAPGCDVVSAPSNESGSNRAGRTLIRAFAFAGAILGGGAFGLAKTVLLFGSESGLLSEPPVLWRVGWWIGIGAMAGFLFGWILVKTRRKSR